MLRIVLCYFLISVTLVCCENSSHKAYCKCGEVDKLTFDKIDSSENLPHFGDVLFVSLKDSLCETQAQYNVIIARVYYDNHKTIIYRLLDKENNWNLFINRGDLVTNKQIRIDYLRLNLTKEKIFGCDTSGFSKNIMPTAIVSASPIEM